MSRPSLFLALGILLFPALAQAQSAPQIWTLSRPLNLSQNQCLREASRSLRAQRWNTTWTEGNLINAEAGNYSAQISCLTNENLVTFTVAGPNRNRTRNLAESFVRGNTVWSGNNSLQPGPRPPFSNQNPISSQNFDEQFYRINNPDVEQAIRSGSFPSGWTHYQQYGLKEGRAPRFDEGYYLSRNADVAEAVRRRQYRNGYDHWNQSGRYEGRPGGIGSLGQPNNQLSN